MLCTSYKEIWYAAVHVECQDESSSLYSVFDKGHMANALYDVFNVTCIVWRVWKFTSWRGTHRNCENLWDIVVVTNKIVPVITRICVTLLFCSIIWRLDFTTTKRGLRRRHLRWSVKFCLRWIRRQSTWRQSFLVWFPKKWVSPSMEKCCE